MTDLLTIEWLHYFELAGSVISITIQNIVGVRHFKNIKENYNTTYLESHSQCFNIMKQTYTHKWQITTEWLIGLPFYVRDAHLNMYDLPYYKLLFNSTCKPSLFERVKSCNPIFTHFHISDWLETLHTYLILFKQIQYLSPDTQTFWRCCTVKGI